MLGYAFLILVMLVIYFSKTYFVISCLSIKTWDVARLNILNWQTP